MFKFAIICAVAANIFAVLFHLLQVFKKNGKFANAGDFYSASVDSKVMGVVFYVIAWFIGGGKKYFGEATSFQTVASHCKVFAIVWIVLFFLGLFMIIANRNNSNSKTVSRKINSSCFFMSLFYGLCAFFLG